VTPERNFTICISVVGSSLSPITIMSLRQNVSSISVRDKAHPASLDGVGVTNHPVRSFSA